jgi:hypothetical protein
LPKHVLLAALTAATISLSGMAAAKAPEVDPANDFAGISYGVSSSGKIVVFAGVREIGGKVAVCGLVFFEKATGTTKGIEPDFTQQIAFSIGGQSLRVQTSLFSRFPSEAEAVKGKARCSATNRAWNAGYAKAKLKMSMPSTAEVRH